MKTKKTAPFDASNSTKQADMNFQPDTQKYLRSRMTAHVRWPGQTCGALGLALNFLCYFLCFKTKKVKGLYQGKETIALFNKYYVLLLLVQKKE